jgi:hypothetical protein
MEVGNEDERTTGTLLALDQTKAEQTPALTASARNDNDCQ